MNKAETTQVLAILRAAYPNFYKSMSEADVMDIINLWHDMFKNENMLVVAASVKALIALDTKGFPPVIGQVKEHLGKITQPERMSEMEAWNHVARALRNSTYNSTQEFEKLPEVVRLVVGSPSQLRAWATVEEDDLQTVVQSNFIRSYRAKAEQKREYLAMPPDVKRLLADAVNGFARLEG